MWGMYVFCLTLAKRVNVNMNKIIANTPWVAEIKFVFLYVNECESTMLYQVTQKGDEITENTSDTFA